MIFGMRRGWIVSAAMALFVTGCGGSAVKCVPVQGQVTVKGKPAAGAVVVFHPMNAVGDLEKLRPYATVDEQGNFSVSCNTPGDGAPPGEYRVTIAWEVGAAKSADPESAEFVPDRLNGKYSKPETSGLTATINATSNQLPPFAL